LDLDRAILTRIRSASHNRLSAESLFWTNAYVEALIHMIYTVTIAFRLNRCFGQKWEPGKWEIRRNRSQSPFG